MQTLTRSDASKQALLNASKRAGLVQLAEAVSQTRARFVTSIPGQEMTYIEKERQALAFLAEATEPDPALPADAAAYAFVFQEVGITGQSAHQVAQVIAFMAAQWRVIGPQIERQRLIASAAIEAAETSEQIDAAIDAYGASVADL